jgi:hypothetical protein
MARDRAGGRLVEKQGAAGCHALTMEGGASQPIPPEPQTTRQLLRPFHSLPNKITASPLRDTESI